MGAPDGGAIGARSASIYYSASVVYKTSGYNSNGYYREKSREDSRVGGRGNSRKKARRKTVQKTRKPIAVAAARLARLGRLERLTLSCIQELGLEYQFRIADVVKCLERHGLPNPNNRLNKRVFDAVNRLVDRGIVVKVGRGIYALRRDLARLSVGGFPLVKKGVREYVVGVENFANTFVRNYVGEVVGKVVEDTVFSPSEDKENLWGRAGVLGGGLTNVQYGGGGFGVVRVHVVNPPGGWVGYYVSVSFVSRVLSFVSSYVRERLVSLYGVSFVRGLDSLVGRSVSAVVSSARVVLGCHGHYNDSPGDFSPLSPDCQVHNYEYGVDLYVPGYFAQVVNQFINYVKVYVKTPDEIKEGNPRYYEDLLRVLGPPPPPPPGFDELLARLGLLGIQQ